MRLNDLRPGHPGNVGRPTGYPYGIRENGFALMSPRSERGVAGGESAVRRTNVRIFPRFGGDGPGLVVILSHYMVQTVSGEVEGPSSRKVPASTAKYHRHARLEWFSTRSGWFG